MAGNVPAASVTQADKVWHLNELVTPYQSQGVTPAGVTRSQSQGVTPAGVTRSQSQGVTPAGVTRSQSQGVTPAGVTRSQSQGETSAGVTHSQSQGVTPAGVTRSQSQGVTSAGVTHSQSQGVTPAGVTRSQSQGETPAGVTRNQSQGATPAVKDEIDRKLRALHVMSMLREYRQPELWSYVSKQFVIEGQLDLSEVLSSKNLQDLLYLLEAGASSGITELFLNYSGVFADEEAGRSLGAAVAKMSQLSVLNVDSCSLTDKSWGQIVGGICQGCHQLETLCCESNNLTDAGSERTMKCLLTQRRQLRIRATACGLSEKSVHRLKTESGDRFHWINYCYGHH
ncbi:hypothetical protein LSAT2_005070 [Lamellibrachia satsuma]|nr:hypothetical protein LSAT2_005070 [Lamellibrachia satsuma]